MRSSAATGVRIVRGYNAGMPLRNLGRRFLVGAIALAAIAAAAAFSIRRIPAGSVGLTGDGLVAEGWHVSLPWNPIRTVPERGDLELSGLAVLGRDGSSIDYTVSLAYRLGPGVSARLAADARRDGLRAALTGVVGETMRVFSGRHDADALLSDPSLVETQIRAALSATGIVVETISARSEAADRRHRSARTAEAADAARPQRGRVLVVGLDAADWQIVDPMMQSGLLPNLARLVREGARASLRSYEPMLSPILWTTVATGKTPDRHGIADFLVRDASGGRKPITSDFRRTKALWNILGDMGRASGWVGWWATFPAEPIRGILATEMIPHSLVRLGPEAAAEKQGLAYPEGFLAEERRRLVPPEKVRIEDVRRFVDVTDEQFRAAVARAREPADPKSKEVQDPATFLVKLLAAQLSVHQLGLSLLERGLPFVAVYYEGIDMIGHRFQHFMPPRLASVRDEDVRRFGNVVFEYYRFQDELLGELLRAAGPGTTTVVLSDHGFFSGADRPTDILPYTTFQPAEWHRAWGLLVLHGPAIRPRALAPATLYDVAPTLLYLAGLPLAEDMQGRWIADAFRPEVAAAAPPRRIPSYELVGEPFRRRTSAPVDPDLYAEMMANLQALGYIGGTPGDEKRPAPEEGADASQTQVFYHRNLATFLIKQGRLDEAERELLLANEREPFPKTYAMLAEVRAARGRFAEAAQALEDGLQKIPDQMDSATVLWLVEMHLKRGDVTAAESARSRWESRTPPAVRSAASGRILDARGEIEAARTRYEAALHDDPVLVHVLLRLYEIYRDEGNPRKILPFLERGVRAAPRADAYHDLLGDLALSSGDPRAAAAHYSRAVQEQPENGVYLGHLATALAAAGDRDEARRTVDWAFRCDPKEPDAWIALGSALDRLEEPDRAISAFQTAKEKGAADPRADLGMALVLARSGRVPQARKVLADARTRYPTSRAIDELLRRLGGA